ncbi:MAG TPA: O-antigen ligase family protein [Gaiellaceae bacterium]|nr:O-antigen ligase family protein [Gaiellaceae bacterium]
MTAIAEAGGVVGGIGLASLLLATTRTARLLGFAGWIFGMFALAAYLAPHGHRGVLAGAALVGLIGAAIGAAILVRVGWVLPFAALIVAPARFPVHVGSTDANLLLPLYGVVAAAALALAWELPGEERRARELGPIAWPLGLWIGWTGLSTIWTRDLKQAAIELVFYVLPFGLLAVCIARLPWSRLGVVRLYALLALMGLVFAAIGIYQWATRDIFWNPKLLVGNAYEPIYRVNSVFYDPSIYGRFLAVAILGSLVVVLARPPLRVALGVVAVVAVTWAGLYYSYSQSSFAALIVGVLIASALVWRRRALLGLALAVVLVAAIALSTPRVRHTVLSHTRSSWNHATSGRASLVANGIRIAVDHPVIGVGVASFKRAYADRLHLKGKEPKAAASHDTPVTVAAETGFPGLLLLLWLIAAALVAAFRPGWGGLRERATAAFGIMVAAIFVHSLFYNALFEDPMFWGLLALTAVAVRQREAV